MKVSDDEMKYFTADLRRVLYITQIYKYNLEWFKMSSLITSEMKNDINSISNAIARMLNNMMYKSTPETWNKVKSELSKDELHDIGNLLDSISEVTNIGEIVNTINEWKQELKAI